MSRALSRDRRSAAVRAALTFDTSPTATYQPDVERIVISVGTAALLLSPGVTRELADSLMGAVAAAEDNWGPDQPDADRASAEKPGDD